MDWMDQYLNELHRPGAVMHFPPDKPSWNAPVPSKQQMSLMQDATVADMVRMRMVQEARQMEMDAGMGGGYDAGSAARETTTVAPSEFGLPNAITIAGAVGASIPVNVTYSKTNQAIGYLGESTNGSYNYYNYTAPNPYITSPFNNNSNQDYFDYPGWVIAHSADGAVYYMTNPSTDKFNFPTTGWVYSDASGGPNNAGQSGPASLTITAAPAGIPAATTTSVNVVDSNGSLTNTYYKESPDYWHPGGGDDKLVWSSLNSRWEFRGDNDYLWGYNNSLGQSLDYIPTTGTWIGQFLGTITITAA